VRLATEKIDFVLDGHEPFADFRFRLIFSLSAWDSSAILSIRTKTTIDSHRNSATNSHLKSVTHTSYPANGY